ncbi:MAG: hypothetical protein JJU45_19145 [Acidimicrobiia bacterium]|nr:hypothetical protein [Acidimicrobiia bacterium]
MAEAGNYRGRHYTAWVEEVKQRKRDSDLEGALEILSGCMAAAESEGQAEGLAPAPWYFEQAAIIHRKRKEFAAEVAVLERYEAACPVGHGTGLAPRLRKARELASKASDTALPVACPACETSLEAVPKRSRKCPHCAETIIVRRSNGNARLLTAEQDQERKRSAEARANDERVLVRANRIGISDPEFENRRRELSGQFGRSASAADTFWSHAGELTLSAARDGEHGREALVRREMAGLLAEEGRDWFEQARLAVEAQLRSISWTRPETLMGVGGCTCGPCTEDRPDMTYAEALRNPPVPHQDCQDPPCQCWLYEHRDHTSNASVAAISVVAPPAPTPPERKWRRWWQAR